MELLSSTNGSVDSSTDSEVFACHFRWSAEWVNIYLLLLLQKYFCVGALPNN